MGLLRRAPAHTTPFLITEYVARHELNILQSDVDALIAEGRLEIKRVSSKKTDPAGKRFWEYKGKGFHKGEAESLAWVKGLEGDLPLFISNDGKARAGFKKQGAPAGDVMDLVVEAIDSGAVGLEAARDTIRAAWDDRPNNDCRPSDYDDFDAILGRRRERRP